MNKIFKSTFLFLGGFFICLFSFSVFIAIQDAIYTRLYMRESSWERFTVKSAVVYPFIMASPSVLGYFIVHWIFQKYGKVFNSKWDYMFYFFFLSCFLVYLFGFLIPVIGMIGYSKYNVEHFIALGLAAMVTFLFLRIFFKEGEGIKRIGEK